VHSVLTVKEEILKTTILSTASLLSKI